ncbi:hypothetical protein DX069_005206 [Escherichia coli]|uniref:hypothetical protein n=1 Tax=Escherichia coli TaxID=562 RepID=UPI000FB71A8A|nr:hypothetical protein [Escherichia coli]EED0198926.1 hypothetical protein [Escherichia coli]EEX7560309.1 hypothetical protein [Escherichia coli]EHY9308189.1 hypothetical protein [Escherichia coli]QCL42048.1 hypothetical protein C9E68_10685 [Escherichia coli]
MIWQPEFTDKTLSRKPGAVHSVKPQPIAVLFKTMGAWAVLCFAADDTDARMAIGQEMEMDPTNDEFIIYGAPSNYLLDTCNIYNKAA